MGEDFCRPFCELSASSSYKEGLSVATCRQTPAPHHPATLAPVAVSASGRERLGWIGAVSTTSGNWQTPSVTTWTVGDGGCWGSVGGSHGGLSERMSQGDKLGSYLKCLAGFLPGPTGSRAVCPAQAVGCCLSQRPNAFSGRLVRGTVLRRSQDRAPASGDGSLHGLWTAKGAGEAAKRRAEERKGFPHLRYCPNQTPHPRLKVYM